MNELPPDIADILRAARSAHEPSHDDEARVLRAVYAASGVLGGAAAGGAAGGAASAAGGTGSAALGAAKAGGAGAALKGAGALAGAKAAVGASLTSKLVAGALVLAGAAGGYGALRGPAAREPGVAHSAAAAPHAASAPVHQAAAAAPSIDAREPSTPSSTAPGADDVTLHPRKPHAHAAHGVRTPDHTAELALIRATQAALRDGQPARALALLREHGARFPAGILSEERTGLEAIARCTLGQLAEGRRVAGRFVAHAPGSPLRERVQAACGDAP